MVRGVKGRRREAREGVGVGVPLTLLSMRRALRPVLMLSVFVIALLPASAAACSYAWPTPAGAAEQATAIFRGRVVASDGDPDFFAQRNVTVLVDTRWKGAIARETRVSLPLSAECGARFVVGEDYLIHAYWDDAEGFKVGHRPQTLPIDQAWANLRYLGPGRPVGDGPGSWLAWARGWTGSVPTAIVATGSLALLSVVALWRWRAWRGTRVELDAPPPSPISRGGHRP